MGFDWLPAKNYKKHFICLNCKKGFKKSSEKDIKHKDPIDVFELIEDYYKSKSKEDIIQFVQGIH